MGNCCTQKETGYVKLNDNSFPEFRNQDLLWILMEKVRMNQSKRNKQDADFP